VRAGEIGEIVVKGPIQMISYWNLPDETRETIKDGWLHTRDLGRLDEDGFVYAVDRMGDMYISGGENVYPAEVERVLLNHPKILRRRLSVCRMKNGGDRDTPSYIRNLVK